MHSNAAFHLLCKGSDAEQEEVDEESIYIMAKKWMINGNRAEL